MHKVVKIIFITFLSITAIAFLISIYLGIKAILPEEDRQTVVTREVLEYLNERYNEEFEVINFIPPSFNYASYIITAVRKGDPKDVEHSVTIHGWVSKEKKLFKKNKVTFYDNYPAIKLIPELKKQVSNIVLQDYPECKIHIKFYKEWIQENINEYDSAEEFLEKDEYWKRSMSIDIFTYNKNIDDKKNLKIYSEKLFKKLANENFRATAEIYFYNDINIYNNINDTIPISNLSWVDALTNTRPECGKDFVYSHAILEESEKLVVEFRDN